MQNHWKGTGGYATIGIELALSVLLGFGAGYWLDKKLGTHPWLAFAGAGLGAAAGFRSLWHMTQRANQEAERLDREEQEARQKYHGDADERRD